MDTVRIDEDIRVGAAFDERRVFPVWFLWRSRYYRVERLVYSWDTSLGIARLHHFSVSDGANQYELEFNAETLVWRLARVYAGESDG